MRTLIKNGVIVNADATTPADVLIDGETIAMVGSNLEASADRTLDATGKWVIPGGIDVHTHMELPFGGTFAKDTFETGTRAAAFGGTTTIIDFAVQPRGGSLRQGLDAWMEKAEGNACIDYAFHMIVSDVRDDVLSEMDTLVDEGVTTFKLFTAYPGVFLSDDGAIFRAMQQTAKNGGMILMHAENGLAIDVVANQNAEAGNTDPLYHGISRSPVMEADAAPATRACPPSPRPARSTSSCRWTTWATGSRARSSSARRPCVPPTTPTIYGWACSRTTCRWSAPITAPSTSTVRRTWARVTSGRSPTGCLGSRIGSTCSTTAAPPPGA
jgi:hypothetical protein